MSAVWEPRHWLNDLSLNAIDPPLKVPPVMN